MLDNYRCVLMIRIKQLEVAENSLEKHKFDCTLLSNSSIVVYLCTTVDILTYTAVIEIMSISSELQVTVTLTEW